MMTSSKVQGTVPTRKPYLKSKNAVYLWSFIGANLAIFLSLIVTKGFSASSVDHFWERVTAKDGMIAGSIPILAIVLSGVLGDLGTARLVFWRWHNPLPGSRAFTELISTDPRIDVPALKKKLGEFPQDPQTQNALWFRLYKKQSEDTKISEAHRIYLLTRDMATISSIFVVLFSIGVVGASINWETATSYTTLLIAQYLVVATAARNYGKRFVLNVLAEESQTV
jgi:hypothetical protein